MEDLENEMGYVENGICREWDMQRMRHAQKWDMQRIVYEDNWPDNEVDMTFIESKASRQMKYKKKIV